MDTPGFTSLEVFGADKDNLKYYYNEFEPYLNKCKFSDCKHLNEPGCEVTNAVKEGKISKLRYENYVEMLTELMNQVKKY